MRWWSRPTERTKAQFLGLEIELLNRDDATHKMGKFHS